MTPPAPPPPRPLGGLTLGRVFGIPIVIMPSWFAVAVLGVVWLGQDVNRLIPGLSQGAEYAVAGGAVLLLYASVLLHELTHSLVAQALGLPVRRIILQLLGGLSEIAGEPKTPAGEYLVAVSGPMTSLLLTSIAFGVRGTLTAHTLAWGIVYLFAVLNLFVAVFNLLPGLPLDGGRVLHAALWWGFKDKGTATRAAAYAGRGLAIAVVIGTVWFVQSDPTRSAIWVIYGGLIGLFLWQSSNSSLVQARLGAVLPSLIARRLTRRALPVGAEVPLAEAVRRANATGSRALVVVDGRGQPDGIVPEAAVIAVPADRRPWITVGSLSRHIEAGLRIPADLGGQDLIAALQRTPATEYLVVEPSGAVYGVLSQADVLAALRAAR